MNAPTASDLADTSQHWTICYAAGRAYVGKWFSNTSTLRTAFEYVVQRQVDPGRGAINSIVFVLPIEMMAGVDEIQLSPDVIIPVHRATEGDRELLAQRIGQAMGVKTQEGAPRIVLPGGRA
jgi:hypothetical protein